LLWRLLGQTKNHQTNGSPPFSGASFVCVHFGSSLSQALPPAKLSQSYPVDAGKWCREMSLAKTLSQATEDTRSSVDLNDFMGEDGLCVIRAICAKTQKTPEQLSGTVKNKLKTLVQQGKLIDDDVIFVFQKEGAYPGGKYQKNVYTTLTQLVQSVGQGAAKGCTADGRYVAFFKVDDTLNHCVCIVKQGSDVKIVDTFIQEKLEKDGMITPPRPEYFFTIDDYQQALQLYGVPNALNPWASVIGHA
jgi:hypothetical protein